MWNELLVALALILVIEGIMPFMNPSGMKKMMLLATQMDDNTLRTAGLISMVSGLVLLYLVL
jgi:uncharacterized protein YjeT (DUF2065 family)